MKTKWIAGVLVCALVGILGWSATGVGRTSKQAAADRKAPSPSVLTAVVKERRLSESVVIAGRLLAKNTVAAVGSAPSGGDQIVSSVLVAVGGDVNEGQVVAEVSGRPVFVVVADVPQYRDLRVGDHGRDVASLKAALGRVLNRRVAGDVYGPDLQGLVNDLYRRASYEPPVDPAGRVPASGGYVDRHEMLVIPSLPAVISQVQQPVGGLVSADRPAVVVAAGPLRFDATVEQSQAASIRTGMRAQVQLPSPTGPVQATVTFVGPVPPGADANVTAVPGAQLVTLELAKSTTLTLTGTEALATVEVLSSGPVLALPMSAIRDDAEGHSVVRLWPQDRDRRVKVGIVAAGWAAVTGIEPGARVRVG